MKKRVKEAEKLDRGKINKDYFYPKKLFRQILKEYKNKKLDTKQEQLNRTIKNQCQSEDTSVQTTTRLPDIQTPPLPNMAMPVVQTARADVNPNTNLTRTQEALLSPEEKIASE